MNKNKKVLKKSPPKGGFRGLYVCLLLFLSLQGYAQKETWNWAFGDKAGLSFHSDNLRSFNATGVTGAGTADATLHNLPGAFRTSGSNDEGVFSISDKEGNLLFYSNGMEIWKADGEQIFSGLGGHNSTAQSGIVVPYPGDEKKYICIGLDELSRNKMGYVIVQANSPTDVSVTGSRVAFSGHTGILGESMSAVRHGNGVDWWIVAPGRGNPTYFNAWVATPEGLNASVPKKITNSEININVSRGNGYFKFTPDGKHFVYPTWQNGSAIYGDFNNQTGEFSNIREISGSNYYGAEFSPDQRYLYLTITHNLHIWDFEALLQGTATTPVKIIYAGGINALQQDAFGRIWGVALETRNMFLIENPNEAEMKLNVYELKDFLLSGTLAKAGLPSFSASWFNMSIIQADKEEFCANTTQSFSVNVTKGSGVNELLRTEWDFGDGTAVESDTNVDGTQTHPHTYTNRGRYTITVKCFRTDGSEVTGLRKTLKVKVKGCRLPVNHNITTMKY